VIARGEADHRGRLDEETERLKKKYNVADARRR
jgi:hypothetical protein